MEVLILVCQDDPNQHFVIVVAAERVREHEYPSSLFLATLLWKMNDMNLNDIWGEDVRYPLSTRVEKE